MIIRSVLVPIDYLKNFYDAEYPTLSDIETVFKVAAILYDTVVLDVDSEWKDNIIDRLLSEVENNDIQNSIIAIFKAVTDPDVKKEKVAFPTKEHYFSLVAAAYETIEKEEPDWEDGRHFLIQILRARDLVNTNLAYYQACNVCEMEFFTSQWHAIILKKYHQNYRRGFRISKSIENLVERYNEFPWNEFDSKIEKAIEVGIFKEDQEPGFVQRFYEEFIDSLKKLRTKSQDFSTAENNNVEYSVDLAAKNYHRLLLPHPSDLTWMDIAELRNSNFREPFIKKVFNVQNGTQGDAGFPEKFLIGELFKILRKNAPKQHGGFMSRILSNIPVPVIGVNPLSVARDIGGARTEIQEYNLNGWLYFLAEAHDLVV